METNGIEVRGYGEVSSDVTLLASAQLSTISADSAGETSSEEKSNDLIWVDPGTCCFALYSKLNLDKVFLQSSPLALAKALKVFSSL